MVDWRGGVNLLGHPSVCARSCWQWSWQNLRLSQPKRRQTVVAREALGCKQWMYGVDRDKWFWIVTNDCHLQRVTRNCDKTRACQHWANFKEHHLQVELVPVQENCVEQWAPRLCTGEGWQAGQVIVSKSCFNLFFFSCVLGHKGSQPDWSMLRWTSVGCASPVV